MNIQKNKFKFYGILFIPPILQFQIFILRNLKILYVILYSTSYG